MIYKDKYAYIYENVFSGLETKSLFLDRFISSKEVVASSAGLGLEANKNVEKIFAADQDLYEVFMWHEDFEVLESLYRNKSVGKRYKKTVDFLNSTSKDLGNFIRNIEKGESKSLVVHEKEVIPHLIVAQRTEDNRIYVFKFLFDNVFSEVLGPGPYKNMLLQSNGEILYSNKSKDDKSSEMSFFKGFLDTYGKDKSGLKETAKADGQKYMIGYWQLKNFKGYVLISELESESAFKITVDLAIKIFIYAIGFIGIVNIITIFLARTITQPLNTILGGITELSKGNFKTKIKLKTRDEFTTVANAFNKMGKTIIEYHKKLEEYNRKLEEKVEERTKELKEANNFIKAMVNSLSQGLFVFDKDGKCLDFHTQACENIFESFPPNAEVVKLIGKGKESTVEAWVQGLFQEMIPFNSIKELGPKVLPCDYDHSDPNFTHVGLEYFPMRNDEGTIDYVVGVATDKTKEFRATLQAEEQKKVIKLISKFLGDKEQFMKFVDEVRTSLDDIILRSKETGEINKSELMLLLHSLKGSSGLYGLANVASIIHDFETYVEGNDPTMEKLEEDSALVIAELDKSMETIKENIGEELFETSASSIDESFIETLRVFLENKGMGDVFVEIEELMHKIPIENEVQTYKELVSSLATQLGKQVYPMTVSGGDILVDKDRYNKFFRTCVHLFRNCIDHGIETPSVRENRGKDPNGSIGVNFSMEHLEESDFILFEVADDGNGIAPDRVRAKMQELEYSEEELLLPDEAIIYKIFDESFSTADQVTELSGRGVGLYDIKKNIEDMGGKLEISSVEGEGTTFKFFLPV